MNPDRFRLDDEPCLIALHDRAVLRRLEERAKKLGGSSVLSELLERAVDFVMSEFWDRIYRISPFCQDDLLRITAEKGAIFVVRFGRKGDDPPGEGAADRLAGLN